MTEVIRDYYIEHKTVFEEKFSLVLESFDMEAIHKMRTTTKRLRGLFQLIEYLSTNKFKAKKQLRKIRVLFKYAGKIREIQIEQLIVWDFEKKLNTNYSEYLEYLLRREHLEIARFLKHLPEIDQRESILNHEEILAAIKSINTSKLEKKANKFINAKTKTLKGLIKKPSSNNTIHRSRTILKQLYYLYDVLIVLSKRKDILSLPVKSIRELEQKIGTWHDLVNSSIYLNAFSKTKYGKQSDKYELLKKSVKNERDGMRKDIVSELRSIQI